jgi:hypothetical protein
MSKHDVSFGPVSPRQRAALEIQDTLFCLGLDEVYGISLTRATDAKGKKYWSITFCKARTIDGVVKVYSDRFIVIKIQQRDRGMPSRFTSALEAKQWLVKEFA